MSTCLCSDVNNFCWRSFAISVACRCDVFKCACVCVCMLPYALSWVTVRYHVCKCVCVCYHAHYHGLLMCASVYVPACVHYLVLVHSRACVQSYNNSDTVTQVISITASTMHYIICWSLFTVCIPCTK